MQVLLFQVEKVEEGVWKGPGSKKEAFILLRSRFHLFFSSRSPLYHQVAEVAEGVRRAGEGSLELILAADVVVQSPSP